MKKRVLIIMALVAAAAICVAAVIYFVGDSGDGTVPDGAPEPDGETDIDETPDASDEVPEDAGGQEEDGEEDEEKEDEPIITEPEDEIFTISFAGDCTLGTEHSTYGSAGSFVAVVGDNYDYPFENVLSWFEADDMTFVNFEGTLTTSLAAADKAYRFRAPLEYAKILTAGSVELVNLANNHTYDFGEAGYADTKAALEAENVDYVEKNSTILYTTESGLKIGVYSSTWSNCYNMKSSIEELRAAGAEIVIASFHWGLEGYYSPDSEQTRYAHDAIDHGADIVFGHHPHVLQEIEEYNGGVIYYSLGNFSFGGNRNPVDKDTAIIQQKIVRDPDGTVSLGETVIIPCCVSDTTERNTYKPTPYEEGSEAYLRVLSKLDGSYAAAHPQSPPSDDEEEETPPGEAPEEPGGEDSPVTDPSVPPAETETPELPDEGETGEAPETGDGTETPSDEEPAENEAVPDESVPTEEPGGETTEPVMPAE